MFEYMDRRTKIICTIGPMTSSKEMIEKLIDAGMNVARLNFSHGNHQAQLEVIETIKQVRKERNIPIGILLDTKGPEMRVGHIEDIPVTPKMRVRLVIKDPKKEEIPVDPGLVVEEIEVGSQILFDDGYIRGFIVAKGDGFADVEIENKGVIKKGKGINVPSQSFNLPFMTEQDEKDIAFGCEQKVDFIAASFINTAQQLLAIREHINKSGGQSIQVIAKIESKLGVKNFDDILQVADGIMIARGDLGVELFVGHVPPIQKMMIRECNLKAKPVIVATQMLESMIHNPTCTRAEASDVANAIYDSGSAVMLSGETAVGEYPIETVKMMHEIILAAEKDFDHRAHFLRIQSLETYDIPSAMAKAAVNTGFHLGASAIVAGSTSGNTVKHITRYRPAAKILAVTPSETTYYQTSLLWGTDCFREEKGDVTKNFREISAFALKGGWAKYGDLMVITLGTPNGVSHTTNTITVESIGNAIVRGHPMEEEEIAPVTGEVNFFLPSSEMDYPDLHGKVIVTNRVEESFIPVLKCAAAVVLQNHLYDVLSEERLERLYNEEKVPYITRAHGASTLLSEGELVRVHPSLGLVFKSDSPTEEQLTKMFK